MSRQEQELVEKLMAHLVAEFGASDEAAMKRMFDRYDRNDDGRIDKRELEQLLAAAGIGSALMRGAWARGVLDKLDGSHDKAISWAEFSAAVASHGG